MISRKDNRAWNKCEPIALLIFFCYWWRAVRKVLIKKQQLETLALQTIQKLDGCWAVVEVLVFPTKFGPNGSWRMAVVNYGGALVSDVNRSIVKIQDQLAQMYELASEH